jgi:hypothetical protein
MSSNQLSLFDQEIWRWIEGYEGDYKVCNFGRVMSVKFGKQKILKNRLNKRGYYQIILWKNGVYKNYRVHLLVARAFLPPCPGDYGSGAHLWQIDHINEDKTNNRVSNLQWLKGSENWKKSNAKLQKENVVAIRADTRSQRVIALEYGITRRMVGFIKNRELWRDV